MLDKKKTTPKTTTTTNDRFFQLKNNEFTDKGPAVVRHFLLKRSVMFDKKTGLEMCS